MRSFAVHALVLLVVACPLLCFGRSADVQAAGDVEAAPCCLACASRASQEAAHSTDSEREPARPPQPDSPCLCQGAIAVDAAEHDAGTAECDVWPWAATELSAGPHDSALAGLAPIPRHFPPLATGRSVCALTQTLLL